MSLARTNSSSFEKMRILFFLSGAIETILNLALGQCSSIHVFSSILGTAWVPIFGDHLNVRRFSGMMLLMFFVDEAPS